MNRLRILGFVCGAFLIAACAAAQSTLEMDEQTLKSHNLPIDGKGLIEFFEKQSLKEGDVKELEGMVRKLGNDLYPVRETARKELVKRGARALPFLRSALTNSTSLEAKRLAQMCIEDIESKMQPAPIAAAARVLASRKEPKSAEVLFNFLPGISDPFLEEEVLGSVGRLTITEDKVDPLLLTALKDPLAFRRHTAAYLIGRRANADHRDKLRELLADKEPSVSVRVAEGLYGKRPFQMLSDSFVADEKLLKGEKIDTTEAGLLKWFRDRTPNEENQKKYRALVRALGSEVYPIRAQANKKLEELGVPALPFLREAESGADLERRRRIQDCMSNIRGKSNPALPIAAAHLLARPAAKKDSSGESIRTLLAYVPFADDDIVEEEVLTCLTVLSLREPAVEAELVKALADSHPMRRGAAAYVLGHVGTKEHLAKVRPLLDADLDPMVRLRAAQGFLAARDKSVLPAFINLISSVPTPHLPKIVDALYRVAEDKAPVESIGTDNMEKVVKAWKKWHADHAATIDLTRINDTESYLGLVTVCEYDNQFNQNNGKAWELPRGGGATRFSFGGLQGAMDAHTLPNGRVLVAENQQNRVTERDNKGNIVWEFRIPFVAGTNPNPVCCQRLPNGNTFIASYNMVMEVRPDKSEVYRIASNAANQFHIFSAQKTRAGNIVMIGISQNLGNNGCIIEMDTKGTRKRTIQTQTLGNWCSVEVMPNGNFLVATMNPANVRELTPQGNEVWRKDIPDCHRATRLPNGNILAVKMNTKEIVEIERPSGNIRWTLTTTGRPWAVHYR